ncbi:MAG: WGR domain-containing protein [Candidatus Thorarchaeota archaeon]
MAMFGKELTTGRLVLKDESTGRHDFWIGETHGKSVAIHFGKVGSPGHRGFREFKTAEAAGQFLESRLNQKIEEGYQQVE